MPRPTSRDTSWASKFAAMEAESKAEPEKGFYTVYQWSKKINRSHAQTLKMCKTAVAEGQMERKMYRVMMPSVGLRSVFHYRLIKGPQ